MSCSGGTTSSRATCAATATTLPPQGGTPLGSRLTPREAPTLSASASLLRRTKDHKLRIDKAAIERHAHFDGKWLIRTSDDTPSPTDLAIAYKQLYEVERGWRDLKGALRLRPVFHHREDRIRSHIQLCWLGLLLIRVAENATGDTWRNLRNELDRMALVTLETQEGRIAKRSATTKRQREILAALEVREPTQILDYELPTPVE